MPPKTEVTDILNRTERYLTGHLLPFWLDRAIDREAGGLLTYFDRDGHATAETDKPFIMQIRMLYTLAAAHRAGYGGGRAAAPEDSIARPLDCSSFGHNMEFVWLLLHAADVLGQPRAKYSGVVRKIADHCVAFGIDRECGGVLVEGPHNAPVIERAATGRRLAVARRERSSRSRAFEKQFWQQAETLIALLDASALFGEAKYWDAFRNVYDFVMAKYVNLAGGGEWYERLDRQGRPIDDAMGHAWKCGYHTVRSMIQVVKRLRAMQYR